MKEWIWLSILMICMAVLGWVGNEAYDVFTLKQKYAGMWLKNYNETEAYNYLNEKDSSGQWVCVNINKILDFDDIVDTCMHEASHELFSRKCAGNPKLCFALMEELEDETP